MLRQAIIVSNDSVIYWRIWPQWGKKANGIRVWVIPCAHHEYLVSISYNMNAVTHANFYVDWFDKHVRTYTWIHPAWQKQALLNNQGSNRCLKRHMINRCISFILWLLIIFQILIFPHNVHMTTVSYLNDNITLYEKAAGPYIWVPICTYEHIDLSIRVSPVG